MRKELVEKTYFTIAELKEKFPQAYQQAIEDNSDWNVDYSDWYYDDFMLDPSTEELTLWKKICRREGLTPLEIQQGLDAGNSSLFDVKIREFDFDRNSYIRFEELSYSKATEKVLLCLLGVPAYLHKFCDLSHCVTSYRHNNCSTFTLELDGDFWESELTEEIRKHENYNCTEKGAGEIWEELQKNVTEEGERFCERALHSIKEDYEYLTSEEAIFESLESNEVEFEVSDLNDPNTSLARRRNW
jgi:hypothetical protein